MLSGTSVEFQRNTLSYTPADRALQFSLLLKPNWSSQFHIRIRGMSRKNLFHASKNKVIFRSNHTAELCMHMHD
jgi:hypothetical protein